MKSSILVISGILLLFISISVVVGRKDPVVRYVGYAPWYFQCGVAYALPSIREIVCLQTSIIIWEMEEAYKKQEKAKEEKNGN